MDNLILVNKKNGIGVTYVPEDLVIVDENENNFHNYVNPNEKPRVRQIVLDSFQEMKYDAFFHAGIQLLIDSGYRSAEYQRQIWYHNFLKYYNELKKKYPNYDHQLLSHVANVETNKNVALPGFSEHQTGLAIDIARYVNREYNDQMRGTFEAEWLYYNAYKYGFILRYPQGKENITGYNFEPWHYRFIGKEYSMDFFDGDYLTLEEYHEDMRLLKKYE